MHIVYAELDRLLKFSFPIIFITFNNSFFLCVFHMCFNIQLQNNLLMFGLCVVYVYFVLFLPHALSPLYGHKHLIDTTLRNRTSWNQQTHTWNTYYRETDSETHRTPPAD